jgi:hypothetical protein
MPRRRTFEDRKFSVNDANSEGFVSNWDETFRSKCRMCADKTAERSGLCGDCYTQSLDK